MFYICSSINQNTRIMNRLQLKALLLSVITECKLGFPLAPNAKHVKREFKKKVGLKPNAKNSQVLNALGLVYKDNDLESDFWATIDKFNAREYLAN